MLKARYVIKDNRYEVNRFLIVRMYINLANLSYIYRHQRFDITLVGLFFFPLHSCDFSSGLWRESLSLLVVFYY